MYFYWKKLCILIYVFLLLVYVFLSLSMYSYCCLCILRCGYPDWGFSVLFSSVVRQTPRFNSQSRGTVRTLKLVVIVLCCRLYSCAVVIVLLLFVFVLLLSVLFYVLKLCVLQHCHRVWTQLQSSNIYIYTTGMTLLKKVWLTLTHNGGKCWAARFYLSTFLRQANPSANTAYEFRVSFLHRALWHNYKIETDKMHFS